MGTRADFYVGRGKNAEWLGSIAWDGHPGSFKKSLFTATTEQKWREAVTKEFNDREDATTPDMGWPWPWEDSRTTDYSYAFDGNKVHVSCFGHKWFDPLEPEPDDDEDSPKEEFPDMTEKQNTTFGKRSGLMIFGVKGEQSDER